ncbi:DUF4350 domain-containing protein [Sphingomonas sp.]|uniref:DUF4350 domain-containing protein n=1 Tax=Sphingomonas sp. TaxID=28214 RepID=UPI00286B44A0|nr:DUF4350 domain-containing protein [Sphingomonas sp.]
MRGRWRAGTAAALVIVLLFTGATFLTHSRVKKAAADRPILLLLTSLPLVFGEKFALVQPGSPALARLRTGYEVKAIALADRASLAGHALLLMAQPRAQTAEALVDLDAWVRAGGRVMLLADPALEWPSERPLGDRLRPPPGFADTGLLAHWGVALSPPIRRGLVVQTADGRQVAYFSPGQLSSTRCALDGGATIARCSIVRGRVTIVADADLLNLDESGAEGMANLDFVMAELAALER